MISVVGIPFDEFSSFLRGAAKAPPKIREAFHSDSSNYFSERGTHLQQGDLWTDHGDLMLSSGESAIHEIKARIAQICKGGDQLLSMGGDHSVSYPVVAALNLVHGPINILHLDAHPDLYEDFEGNRYSHACPFARIMEEGLAKRLVQVGIRTMNAHQRAQADKFGVEVIEMRDWKADRQFKFDGPLYVSLDMDVIDPAFAPGVSHHEPGGFSSREVISIIQQMSGSVIGADLVEYNPTRDINGMTAMVAAKLFKELMDMLIQSR